MFGTIRPSASLSSGLLARKGQARPAMRPQGFHTPAVHPDDLGWNDMGEGAAPVVPISSVAPPPPADALPPPVLAEREALEAAILPPEPGPPAAVDAAAIRRTLAARSGKAAFTLRLDAERHLRLRLASASRNRSAQQIVVAALDALLATYPEVERLARHLDHADTHGEQP